MRAVVQRVSNARVDIDGATAGSIGRGLLILLGVGHDDSEEQAERLWSKIARLRIFEDAEGKTNLSLADVGGEVLVVSQFTLFANCRRGNRPSFTEAGAPDEANRLYEWFVERARRDMPRVETGRFGAYMDVSLTNDGPFTLWHAVRVEPRLSLLASGALRIFDEQNVRHGFLLRVAAFVSRSSYQSGLKQPQSEANGRRMPRRRNVSRETFVRFDPAGNGEGRPRRSRRARRSNVQMFHVKHRNRLRLQKGHRSRRLGLVY